MEAKVLRSDTRKADMRNPAKQSVSWRNPILFGVTVHGYGCRRGKDWLWTARGRPPEPVAADGRESTAEERAGIHGRKNKVWLPAVKWKA